MSFFQGICLCFLPFLFAVLFLKPLIPFLKRRRVGQSILEIGPAWHKPKEGTPTMGGIVFLFTVPLFAAVGNFLIDGRLSSTLLFILLFSLANGLIGLLDDATKFKNKRNLGLLPWQKLTLQTIFLGAFFYLQFCFGDTRSPLTVPFIGIGISWNLPLLFFFFILSLGILNSVNLSDGIDGLTASSTLVLGVFFLIEGILFRSYALVALALPLVGTMLAFLIFNRHPAKIFMGDTGSLFLGALIVGCAHLTQNPLSLPIYAFLFLLEGGSVILQVLIFKRTGRRLFRMAPIHHHLEKSGWSEGKVVLCFSFITLLASIFAHFAFL